MEYTKDLIFNVRYNEVKNTIEVNKNKWTSRLINKIKKHKIITVFISMATILTLIDAILMANFINLIEKL